MEIEKFKRLSDLIGIEDELIHGKEDISIEDDEKLHVLLTTLHDLIPRLEQKSGYKIKIKISK